MGGEESEGGREEGDRCMFMAIHAAVWQKPTQYCKNQKKKISSKKIKWPLSCQGMVILSDPS